MIYDDEVEKQRDLFADFVSRMARVSIGEERLKELEEVRKRAIEAAKEIEWKKKIT